MHQSTLDRISANAAILKRIHLRLNEFREILPLLSEGYMTALNILDFDSSLSDEEVALALGMNKQSVSQIRKALNV